MFKMLFDKLTGDCLNKLTVEFFIYNFFSDAAITTAESIQSRVRVESTHSLNWFGSFERFVRESAITI